MVARPLLLGLDVGTTRIKALLIDPLGAEVRLVAAMTPWDRGVELTVGRLHETLRSLLVELGEDRRDVVSVGVAGMAESGAPIDHTGRALGPVIAWHDPRGGEVVARLVARFGEQLASWTGQPVRTVSSVAKLGWLVDQGIEGVSGWLGVPELCLHRLTGNRVTEYSLAARTGWYHVAERRYLPDVAQAAGIGPGVFPPVEPAGAVMGRISATGAAWSGLPAGIPVTLAGHDHLVGMVGSGADRHDLVNSVGTAETVVAGYRELPDIGRALSLRIAVSVMPGGERWALLAGAARAGIVLASLASRLGCSATELDALGRGAGVAETDSLLDGIERGEPIALTAAPAGAIWNGMTRSLSGRTWQAVGRLTVLTGPAPRLVVFGGGSRSRPWLSEKARAGWLPVWRSMAAEAVARGAALYAGTAVGWWRSSDTGPRAGLELVQTG